MDPIQLKTGLRENGIPLFLPESQPALFAELSALWEKTLAFRHRAGKLFLDQSLNLSQQEIQDIQVLLKVHEAYSSARSPKADAKLLRKISMECLPDIEKNQKMITTAMSMQLKEIFKQIGSDDLRAIQLLIASGIDVNQKDKDGLTPLSIAAQGGAKKCAEALCKIGANPHVTDSAGNAPLHWAAAFGKSGVAEVLLFYGASANAVNHAGGSPLMLSLTKGALGLAQKLLDYGADFRLKDRRGNTAMHRAIQQKNKEAALFLFESGASIDEPNGDLASAKDLAARDPQMKGIFDPPKPGRRAAA